MSELAVPRPIPHSWLADFRQSHGARLHRLAQALLGQDAEDGVQDAYQRLVGLELEPDEAQNREAYLWTVARRAVLDTHRRFRRRRVERTLDEAIDAETLAVLSEEPSALADRAERNRFLRDAIGTLPAGYREALVLRDVEGLRYAEIAETVGIPIGTVRSRLAAATAELARRLRHWLEEDER